MQTGQANLTAQQRTPLLQTSSVEASATASSGGPVALNVGFLYTSHCNARCGHCSTDCGPKSRTYLDEEAIYRTIEEAAAAVPDRPLQVCLSGGEPFLDLDLLNRLIARARSRASDVTCVTNAFWATDPDSASAVLERVSASGLTGLAFSASAFHEAFVPSGRVVIGLAAAANVGLKRILKFPVVADGESAQEWAKRMSCDLDGVTVEQFPVMPRVRAGTRLPDAAFRRAPGIPEGSCPSAVITYRETGDVFTCCTPGGFVDPLRLGHVAEEDFHDILSRFVGGGVQQILRKEGPSYFVPHIRRAGLDHKLRDAFEGVCDLCTHLFSDPEMAAACERVAAEREVATLASWLGVAPAPASSMAPPEEKGDLIARG
jgi:Radical SAM superfamily/4Fe-4S single cluster domain